MNDLTDTQHLENLVALFGRNGYVDLIYDDAAHYLMFIGRIPCSVSIYMLPSTLNNLNGKLIHKLELKITND